MSRFRVVHDALEKNPIVVTETIEEALDRIEEGGYIFATQEDSVAMQLSKERCNIFYFTDGKQNYFSAKSGNYKDNFLIAYFLFYLIIYDFFQK